MEKEKEREIAEDREKRVVDIWERILSLYKQSNQVQCAVCEVAKLHEPIWQHE